ncbi:synaptotagmin-5 isoform X2 [Vitis vinifera]|uniref:synaptotagmin-5 isoform X2 n=2 Tax=Vitis TaxID=3603 RepID=UPI00053FC82B|nr:synaptotagmin-5 isoform X2 [Vitis vinifera]|eukprot:XP_010648679.1 PREDICTED: synaptotagmin-5 isoform X2 [Vitis vinifera]
MSFFFGIVIGIACGIAVVVVFARLANLRSKSRCDLATTVAAFARMTVQDSRKILPPQFYPSWVVFSQQQKLTWLNSHLRKIWPYVDEAASELIRSNVEPILEQYRPVILSALKFSKLTLGTVAPQFTGVSILEGEAGEVSMELEMQWDGNPNIVLDIKTRVGVGLPVQVKNIGFTGVFRLIFKPMVEEFPCFGAVCYSLREKETILDAIEDSITWPVRKIVPIIPGDYSDLELKPVGTLEVKLVQARDLTNKDLIGKSDPYAVLFVRPIRDRMKTSKTINNELNPIWNEHFEFIVEDASTQHLTVRIFDDEGVQASELIGCAQVRLKDLEPGKVKDVWLKLVKDLDVQRDKKYRGEVRLELLYCPFGMESVFTNPFRPNLLTSLEKVLKADGTEADDIKKSHSLKKRDIIVRGVLSVTVISAENLPVVDLIGKADPYVELTMKKSNTKHRTRVVNNSLNPIWNQTFDFVVEDGLHDMLILDVWDHDTFGKDKIGRCIFTLTRVILEGEFRDNFPLEGAKSGSLNLHLKWSPQPIFRDT